MVHNYVEYHGPETGYVLNSRGHALARGDDVAGLVAAIEQNFAKIKESEGGVYVGLPDSSSSLPRGLNVQEAREFWDLYNQQFDHTTTVSADDIVLGSR